jgi:tripartite-type tricarboxylate transporter receptor subunit TctC
MASSGKGGIFHLVGELFKMMTDVDMVHVPYRGSPAALADLISGKAQVMFLTIPQSIDYIKAGKLRALAVTTAMRSDLFHDVPAVGEFVPGFEASGFQGFCAPKNTPAEVIERLNKAVSTAVVDPQFKSRLAEFGSTVLPLSAADFAKLISNETEKWARVIKFAGIKP